MYEYEDYIEHHGIRGQKWGIRRFQNPDGTRTAAGKRRERENYDDSSNSSARAQNDHSNLKKGLAIAGTMALGAALIANPSSRNVITKYGKMAVDNLPGAMAKAGAKVGKGAAKLTNKVAERATKVGDAMIDAALISIGGIAVSKVNQRFADSENATEAERNKNQILRDTIGAGIRTATGGTSNSNGNKTWVDRTGTHVGKDISEKIGPPSNQNIDRSSKAWQDLFKDSNGNQRDADTRATIKSMANAGYDIEQIDRWLNHSSIDLSQYMDYVIGW